MITIEENALSCGFGSAVLEFAEAHDIKGVAIKRMGIPDEFIEHGSRGQLLSDLSLDKDGIWGSFEGSTKIGEREILFPRIDDN